MAVVFNTKRRPIGKVVPHINGSIAAFDGKRHRLGLFVNESMAVMAILDCANKPLQVEGFIALVEAFIEEDGDEIAASIEAESISTEVEQPPAGKPMEMFLNPW